MSIKAKTGKCWSCGHDHDAPSIPLDRIARLMLMPQLTDAEIVKACEGITIEAARGTPDGMTIAMGRAVLEAARKKATP